MTIDRSEVPGLQIRQFVTDDLQRLQAIRGAAFAPVFDTFRQAIGDAVASHALAHADVDQAKLLEDLCSADSNAMVLVAERAGEVLGFVSYTVTTEAQLGEIGLNAVHPGQAGQGIGTALYSFALEQMRASGVKVVEVSTGCDPSHAPARRAYAKAGFAEGLRSITMYAQLD